MRKLLVLFGAMALVVLGFSGPAAAFDQLPDDPKNQKVDVCHVNGQDDYNLINISESAYDKHLEHGDAAIGSTVEPGVIWGANCEQEEVPADLNIITDTVCNLYEADGITPNEATWSYETSATAAAGWGVSVTGGAGTESVDIEQAVAAGVVTLTSPAGNQTEQPFTDNALRPCEKPPTPAYTTPSTTQCNMTNWTRTTTVEGLDGTGWTGTVTPATSGFPKNVEQGQFFATIEITDPWGASTSNISGGIVFRPAGCEPAVGPAAVVYDTVTSCTVGGWHYTVTAVLDPALAEQSWKMQGSEYTAKWRSEAGQVNVMVPGTEAYSIGRDVGAAQYRWVPATSTVIAADGRTQSLIGKIFVPRPAC